MNEKRVDLIKIDIDGLDFQALKGCSKYLENVYDSLLCKCLMKGGNQQKSKLKFVFTISYPMCRHFFSVKTNKTSWNKQDMIFMSITSDPSQFWRF